MTFQEQSFDRGFDTLNLRDRLKAILEQFAPGFISLMAKRDEHKKRRPRQKKRRPKGPRARRSTRGYKQPDRSQ